MDLTALGFRTAGHARLFARRKRLRVACTAPTSTSFSTLSPGDRRLVLEHDFGGKHVDFSEHRLHFRLRVPNLQWFENVAETGRPFYPHGIELTLEEARDRLQTGTADIHTLPRCTQASRLFERVRIINGDQVVVLEQEQLNLLCELLRWREDPRPEVCTELAALLPSRDPPAPLEGVDICNTVGEVQRLYSPDGIYISMRIDHDLIAPGRGFWPAQRFLRFEFTMAPAVHVLHSELPPHDVWRQASSSTLRAIDPITAVPDRLLQYEILDAAIEVDVVELGPVAEGQLRAQLRGAGVPVTYRQHRHHQRTFEPHTEEVRVAPHLRLANLTRWYTVFRPDSQVRSGYHDSFSFRNPDLERAQWLQGSMRIPEHPIEGPHYMYECAERSLPARSDRLNIYNFVGAFQFEIDALSQETPQLRDVFFGRFTQPRAFHLVADFRRDLDRSDDSGMSGLSTFQDHDLELRIRRHAFVPRAAADLPRINMLQPYSDAISPDSARISGGYANLHPLLNLTRDVRVFFQRLVGSSAHQLVNTLTNVPNSLEPQPSLPSDGYSAQWQITAPLPGEQWLVDTFLEHTAQVQFGEGTATITAF